MNKFHKAGIAVLLCTLVTVGAFGAKVQDKITRFGESGTADPVKLIFDTGDGASNVELQVNSGQARFNNGVLTSTAITGGSISNTNIDLGTASNTQRITLSKSTTALLQALTRKEGNMFYDTDQKSVVFDDGTDLRPVGSGSGQGEINYVANPNFEINNNGYTTYDDGAAAPVDGSGGTVDFLTITSETTTPLRGKKSLKLNKSASNAQGEGVRVDFNVDPADSNKTLKISFDYITSANYVAGDLGAYLFCDIVGTPTTIVPSQIDLPASSGLGQTIQFTFDHSDDLDCRFMFHVKTTSALAYTYTIDNFLVGPGTVMPVPAVGIWTTPTSGATFRYGTTVATNLDAGNPKVKYKRVSDSIDLQASINFSGAANANGTIRFYMPDGLLIDSAALPNALADEGFSMSATFQTNGKIYEGVAIFESTDYIFFRPAGASGPTITSWTGNTTAGSNIPGGVAIGASDYITINIRGLPVAQWAGSPTYTGVNDYEVAYNTSGTTTAGATENSGSFYAYGWAGATIGSIASTTTTANSVTKMRVRFSRPLQNGEIVQVYLDNGNNAYTPVGVSAGASIYDLQSTAAYGIGVVQVNSTDFDVSFGNGGRFSTGASFGSAGAAWSGIAAWKWVAVKGKLGATLGFGPASTSSSGLITAGTQTLGGDKTFNGNHTFGQTGNTGNQTINGTLQFGTGSSATAPTYGLRRNATNALEFFTNSTSAGSIDSSGNWTTGSIRLPTTGGTQVPLNYYEEDTFVATLTGCTSNPTITAKFIRVGKLVQISMPSNTCTSNSTAATITGMPSRIYPTSAEVVVLGRSIDASTSAPSEFRISTSGVITFFKDINANLFTASGLKGHGGLNLTYNLN